MKQQNTFPKKIAITHQVGSTKTNPTFDVASEANPRYVQNGESVAVYVLQSVKTAKITLE